MKKSFSLESFTEQFKINFLSKDKLADLETIAKKEKVFVIYYKDNFINIFGFQNIYMAELINEEETLLLFFNKNGWIENTCEEGVRCPNYKRRVKKCDNIVMVMRSQNNTISMTSSILKHKKFNIGENEAIAFCLKEV